MAIMGTKDWKRPIKYSLFIKKLSLLRNHTLGPKRIFGYEVYRVAKGDPSDHNYST